MSCTACLSPDMLPFMQTEIKKETHTLISDICFSCDKTHWQSLRSYVFHLTP